MVITDRDRVISCAGVPKKETVERRITQALENVMESRTPFIFARDGEPFRPIEGVERDAAAAFPIIGAGDVSGAVVLLSADGATVPSQTEIKRVQVKEPSRDGALERHLHRRSNLRSGESFR